MIAAISPTKRALFESLRHQPKPRAVEIKHLQTRVPFVGKNKERPRFHILRKSLGDQAVKPIEALAHIARLHREEHPQTACETQHAAPPAANARNKTAAIFACSTSTTST